MEKKQVKASEVLVDLKGGMTDAALMEKYGLSEKGLESLLEKLLAGNLLKQTELDKRKPISEKSIEIAWKCPACGMPQLKAYDECPQCGVNVSKFLVKRAKYEENAKVRVETDAGQSAESEISKKTVESFTTEGLYLPAPRRAGYKEPSGSSAEFGPEAKKEEAEKKDTKTQPESFTDKVQHGAREVVNLAKSNRFKLSYLNVILTIIAILLGVQVIINLASMVGTKTSSGLAAQRVYIEGVSGGMLPVEIKAPLVTVYGGRYYKETTRIPVATEQIQ